MKALLSLILLALCLAIPAGPAQAHALDPGFLSVEPVEGDLYRVTFRRPDVSGRPMPIDVVLPKHCEPRTGPEPVSDGRGWVSRWAARCPGGLGGGVILIDGLENTRTDTLLRYTSDAGTPRTHRFTAHAPSYTIAGTPGASEVLVTYFVLGFEHILEGIDHLLFVLALMLLIRNPWPLLGAVTAFTVAHSITLAGASLGWVALPSAPVEAVIALSIVFLALELARRQPGQPSLTEQRPWLVTFAFGLLHGFGFAGALREIGLPEGEVPLALLAFNLGVEAGQIVFIFAMLALIWTLNRMLSAASAMQRVPFAQVGAYAIGGIASAWLFERVAGL